MTFSIIQGDNRDTLKTLRDNSIDAIVTDPPYGIDFLGKAWDANTGALETYQECLRVLKPGAHILAFSAARTYHYLAVTLEQAGFEIRDQIMWIYSSGFPKSQDVGKAIQKRLGVKKTQAYKENIPRVGGKGTTDAYDMCQAETVCTDPEAIQWAGWGTALKPAHEPIALARKPIKLSIARNCQEWGTGAINIDATRVGREGVEDRFPSNVIGEILQEDYQKYFYCPKVSRRERHTGFDTTNIPTNPSGMYDVDGTGVMYNPNKKDPLSHISTNNPTNNGNYMGTTTHPTQHKSAVGNNHPTVKPVELMKYLIKLITPPGGTVLDPFCGSGSTGMAAVELGHTFMGCELDPNYVAIAHRRIEAWKNKSVATNNYGDLFEE
jgi:site-specific DNA-methyltransferase (adenine-specific)